jgi:Dyp-type peroxidase family
MEKLDLADIQGIVARGYGNLRAASYVLLEITDPPSAGAWLGALSAGLTTAEARPETRALNLAFTPTGLGKLGLGAARDAFSGEFTGGMAAPHRRRLLGDVDENAPERWRWGGPTTPAVDGLLMLYAADRAGLTALYAELAGQLAGGGVREVLRLETSDLDDVEHFGFRDGISQPLVEGLSRTGPPEQTVKAGEFVLGYRNEYGRYASRPTLDRAADPNGLLPEDPEGSGRADLGRNGTYLVFRQLVQDVRGFWRFVDGATRRPDGGTDPAARLRLAAKLVGRWPSGAPLALAPERDDPALADANDFAYHLADEHGQHCPIGAHVRRTNPRDSLDPRPGTSKSWAINKRHRLLRRGREYGPALAAADLWAAAEGRAGAPAAGAIVRAGYERDASRTMRAAATAEAAQAPAPSGEPDPERGLHFICLNASLARQFEFVQSTWVHNPKFGGLYDDRDPLVAARVGASTSFTIPGQPVRERVGGLPQFVTLRGGGYFFLPGIRAVRYLASLGARRP